MTRSGAAHPEIDAGIRRALERRIRIWREFNGPKQNVTFRQDPMGRLGLSDFTAMGDHGISIDSVPLDHPGCVRPLAAMRQRR